MMRRIAVACVYTLMVPMLLAQSLPMGAESIASLSPYDQLSYGAGFDPEIAIRPGDRAAVSRVHVNRSVIDLNDACAGEVHRLVLPQLRVKFTSTPLPSILVPPD